MQSREAITNFCGPRELLELARVCAGWRQTPEIARVVRVFHDALHEEPFTQIISRVMKRDCKFASPKGQLSTRSTPLVWLRARLSAAFTCARMHHFARFFVEGARNDDEEGRLEMQTIIAAIASCNVECTITYRHKISSNGFIYCRISIDSIMREVVAQGIARADECRKIADIIYGNHLSSYSESIDMLWGTLDCANPSREMIDYMDCIVTGDVIGICAHLPFEYKESKYASIRREHMFRSFGVSSSMIARISPTLARVLVEDRHTMHHVAAQFSYNSPEFMRYMMRFDAQHKTRRWTSYRCKNKVPRREIFANLLCAARNSDVRVFEWVFARLDEWGIILAFDGKCDILRWNCGEGFRGLQMLIERLEGKGMIANFGPEFWEDLQIDALAIPEAIQCLDFILARRPDIREICASGLSARELFKYALARFGEPMRELLAKYHVAIMYETVL